LGTRTIGRRGCWDHVDGKKKTTLDTREAVNQEVANTGVQPLHANTQNWRRSINHNSDIRTHHLGRARWMGTSGVRSRPQPRGRNRSSPVLTRRPDRPRKTIKIAIEKGFTHMKKSDTR
jgi:hypothetical protein